MTNSARLIRGGLSRTETDNLNAEAWRVRDTAPARASELTRLTRSRSESTDYRRGIGQARVVQAYLGARDGDPGAAVRECLAALVDLEPDGPTAWLAWAHITIGRISAVVGEDERAAGHVDTALEIAAVVGDVEALADARVWAARVAAGATDVEGPLGSPTQTALSASAGRGDGRTDHGDPGVVGALRDAVADLASADLPVALGRTRYLLAHNLLAAGAVAEAAAVARLAVEDSDGLPTTRLACSVVAARAALPEEGRDAALEVVRDALAGSAGAAPEAVAAAGALLAELEHDQGDLRAAIDTLLDVRETIGQSSRESAPLARQLSGYYSEVGDFGSAYEMLRAYRAQQEQLDADAVRRRMEVLDVLYENESPELTAEPGIAEMAGLPLPASGLATDRTPPAPAPVTSLDVRGPRHDAPPAAEPTVPTVHGAAPDAVPDPPSDASALPGLDAVTGLPDPRALDRELAGLATQTRRRSVCLALIDIDGLALVNAERGRLVGDSALRQVAGVLRRSMPPTAVLARLDGEDFGLLLDGTELEDAAAACERLRAAVENRPLVAELRGHVFTVSIGVAQADTPFDAERLVRVADDALYEAKDAGRNRVRARRTVGGPVVPPHGIATV